MQNHRRLLCGATPSCFLPRSSTITPRSPFCEYSTQTKIREEELELGSFDVTPSDTSMHVPLKCQPVRIFKPRYPDTLLPLDIMYEERGASADDRNTVLAVHGSPGSHRDFKYLVPYLVQDGFQTIAPNWPGFGISQTCALDYTHDERRVLLELLMNARGESGQSVPKILIGHSLGCYAVLGLLAKDLSRYTTAVLLNSIGLRLHRAIRASWIFKRHIDFYEGGWVPKSLLDAITVYTFNKFGLKLSEGDHGLVASRNVVDIDYDEVKRFVNTINSEYEGFLLNLYGGSDPLIEQLVSFEFADGISSRKYVFERAQDEQSILADIRRRVFDHDERRFSVEFRHDGHFLQRTRPQFIAQLVNIVNAHRRQTTA